MKGSHTPTNGRASPTAMDAGGTGPERLVPLQRGCELGPGKRLGGLRWGTIQEVNEPKGAEAGGWRPSSGGLALSRSTLYTAGFSSQLG
ncbi:hypothetical protein JRQ81_018106 [Phrynocephalus forsythii]|uniref:Uncharacterized protein n=1 Tax=Phrynocephalus forsythii TaxID=171643 RepID=A0A9Q0XRM0_9SAUR|nr:hypothetical protein JRQ81_018106 [Phrynocephalus forsythii]